MIGDFRQHGARLRLAPKDAVTIHGKSYRVVGQTPEGYVLENITTALSEAFGHERLASLSAAGHLEYAAGHHSSAAAKARLKAGADSLAALPVKDQQRIAWRLEWITRYERRMEAETAANAGQLRRDHVQPKIGSRAGDEKALREIWNEIRELEVARTTPRRPDGTTRKPRKPRCGSEIKGYNGPDVRTFRTWLRDHRSAPNNPLILRPQTARCGNRAPRFPPEVERLLTEHAGEIGSEHRRTAKRCHRSLKAAIDLLNQDRVAQGLTPYRVPSDRTVSARIASLSVFEIDAKRIGVEAATRTYRFITGSAGATRPGERLEMDEWKIDLFTLLSQTDLLKNLPDSILDELRSKRWQLCAGIDVATRCILGMHLDRNASTRNALATLEMAVSDKQSTATAVGALSPWMMAARFETVVTDSGSSFIDERFHRAVLNLGSSHDVPPAGLPHLRGTIERMFRTIGLQFVREFTGQSFENVVALGEYPAQDRASITIESFALGITRYVVDAYHNTPHAGLGGETPAHAWARLNKLYGVIPIPGRNERRAIFGLQLERVVGRHGVRFMGLDYRAIILRELYLKRGGITVPIRVDPRDIGQISIEIDGDWHEVSAATSGFDGVTLADHTALCEQLRARYADRAKLTESIVLEAIRAIQARATAAEREATFMTRFNETEDVERAERNLMTFVIPGTTGDTIGAGDPFADAIPTGGSENGTDLTGPRPSTAQTPAPKPRRRSMRIEPDPGTPPRPKRTNFRIDD
ncbi:Mu transposase C-terminal domain-containing protein [Methylobacterium sp. E-016]|uniref:Mu transposase C-terminal domain-containing protein n=1 Tax=Methylobacterium sp. E-016 TaxID=2836556 RepID=UPI001FB919FE|nr:Mu transposase C-terminal domain-containing protein [Methylobacterium sp. E-016]MCJ2075553.1 Mu transposase C-terminal domain-containing protein [Methylobacterium sp. E-016]